MSPRITTWPLYESTFCSGFHSYSKSIPVKTAILCKLKQKSMVIEIFKIKIIIFFYHKLILFKFPITLPTKIMLEGMMPQYWLVQSHRTMTNQYYNKETLIEVLERVVINILTNIGNSQAALCTQSHNLWASQSLEHHGSQ